MSNSRLLRKQPKLNDLRASFNQTYQVSAANTIDPSTTVTSTLNVVPANTTAVNTTSCNPLNGNRTFLFNATPPPSPSTSAGSYHHWTGPSNIAPQLRTLGGFPYHIPGDNGEGYENPIIAYDLDEDLSFASGSSIYTGVSTTASVEMGDPRVHLQLSSEANTCTCISSLRTLLSQGLTQTTTLLKRSTHKLPALAHSPSPFSHSHPIIPPHQIAHRLQHYIDAEFLQIHLHSHSRINTPSSFLAWMFGFYDIRRRVNGRVRRAEFPEPKYQRLDERLMCWWTASDLESGALWVRGDVEEGLTVSLVCALRGLIR